MADQWTILEALNWIEQRLTREGEENPRLAAQMLAGHATGLSRIELYTSFDKPLDEDERAVLRESIQRRLTGEPLQYIIGSVGFRHIELKVRPPVLIPRPETEQLVECVLGQRDEAVEQGVRAGSGSGAAEACTKNTLFCAEIAFVRDFKAKKDQIGHEKDKKGDISGHFGAKRHPEPRTNAISAHYLENSCTTLSRNPEYFLDIGTGTGAIALSLLAELPNCHVYATDIDEAAIALANENARELKLDEDGRLHIRKDDLASSFVADEAYHGYFDLVLSNPPYIPTAEYEQLPIEILQYESKLALDGGTDGLDVFRRIAKQAEVLLKPGGILAVELHENSLEEAAAYTQELSYSQVQIHKDLTERNRFLTAIKTSRRREE
ncbi:MAG: peptide chain release factor N(5)-glutamine methyltransferase [Coriobacteriia bacterium]|nr:peptide chain release factor N(5)-glutamine methyltransferase [Coriobacteriia bacterium]